MCLLSAKASRRIETKLLSAFRSAKEYLADKPERKTHLAAALRKLTAEVGARFADREIAVT